MESLCDIGCISCCTTGIHKLDKEGMSRILHENTDFFKSKTDGREIDNKVLKEYVKALLQKRRTNKLKVFFNRRKTENSMCEYLGFVEGRKAGCLIHPKIIGKDLRPTAPKTNLLRGKCTHVKMCGREELLHGLPEKDKQKFLSKIGKDFYNNSMLVKFFIAELYAGKDNADKVRKLCEKRECKVHKKFSAKIKRISPSQHM